MKFDFYGDKFKWFVGVVKGSFNDKNRVQVRIFGIHKTDDVTDISDEDLPPAIVLYPTTGGSTSGGNLSHGLKHGTWVFGFFADGDNCQQPVIIGVIDGGVNSGSNLQSDSNRAAAGVNSDGSLSSADYTGSTSTLTSQTSNVPGGSDREKAYNMLYELIEKSGRSGGSIHDQVCGIMGNIERESSFNIGSRNRNDAGAGKDSVGICQWNQDRLANLYRMFGTSPNLEQQISFLWWELQHVEKGPFAKLLQATNLTDAVIAMICFERPKGVFIPGRNGGSVDTNHSEFKIRYNFANGFKQKMKYTPRDVYASRGR